MDETTAATRRRPSDRPVYLYRSDDRTPGEIFQSGFHSRGRHNLDLDAFINSGSNPANAFRFISFTADPDLNFFQNAMLRYYGAGGPGRDPFVGYRYRIEASNFEYQSIRSLEHAAAAYPNAADRLHTTIARYPHQREWVALDFVESRRIVDAQVLEHIRGSSPEQFRALGTTANPHYTPGRLAGGNPGPFIFRPG